jgi:hypothetical protein
MSTSALPHLSANASKLHRIVPSSGGQPISTPASITPFGKVSNTSRNQRKANHDSWAASASHARKVLLPVLLLLLLLLLCPPF